MAASACGEHGRAAREAEEACNARSVRGGCTTSIQQAGVGVLAIVTAVHMWHTPRGSGHCTSVECKDARMIVYAFKHYGSRGSGGSAYLY